MSSFNPVTPSGGILIPVPSGWTSSEQGDKIRLVSPNKKEELEFEIEPTTGKLKQFCKFWGISVQNEYDSKWQVIGVKERRYGVRNKTDWRLMWLINQR